MRATAGSALPAASAAAAGAAAWSLGRQADPVRLDHDAWTRYLHALLAAEWRVGEFDPQRWLFTGDPANPRTTTTRCRVVRCDAAVGSRTFCGPCQRRRQQTGLDPAAFAATHRPLTGPRPVPGSGARLAAHQFSLAVLAPTVRCELLYALQQRDRQGHKLDPVAVKGLVNALSGVQAWALTPYQEIQERIVNNRAVRAYANLLTRIVHLRFEAFGGVVHTDKDVWDALALDLDVPRPGRRANLTSIDFTPISQRWLRETVKEWVRVVRPDTNTLARTLQATTLTSRALSGRPGGGHQAAELKFADITAVFQAIKNATRTDGRLYNSHLRRGLWARFHTIIDFGRATELLAELPGTFSRHAQHSIRDDDLNEDEIGKAVPETVIAQLDAHLDLLEAGHTYGRVWSGADTAALFRTAYQLLRDTGRRPGEVVSLTVDCLEHDNGEYALIYDNHKKRRLRRRLPVTADTAEIIARWQRHHATLALPARNQRWLFPSCHESTGAGHLTTLRLATALRRWVTTIPALHSDLPTPDGSPLPVDRSTIYPYAFRHSYAQRHADAGVGIEVLKELMDHRDLSVTQGYYKVSLTRKRAAVTIMSRYVHDHTGTPTHGPASATEYELRSVSVPFGNCIEPSNVKAGGKQCPIRFQCAGCGFYRPDPSYLPAIEDHIHALKADRETAAAMGVAEFVTRNLTDQTAAFTHVADTMRDTLTGLPEPERAEVEQAGAVLRKLCAARDYPLLPLTVIGTP